MQVLSLWAQKTVAPDEKKCEQLQQIEAFVFQPSCDGVNQSEYTDYLLKTRKQQ
jgi:hypothetical protein